jgi:hypothetical protein
MSSFRFGLLAGFVAGITFTALWNSEPERDRELPLIVVEDPPKETVIVVEEPLQESDSVEITTSQSQAD